MNRSVLLVFACLVFPLAACAWLREDVVDAPGVFPSNENSATEVPLIATAPASTTPPPFSWMSSQNMEFYSRLAKTIVTGEPLNTSGFTQVEIEEAYNAIFPSPSSAQQYCYTGWFSTFDDGIRWMSQERVRIFQGRPDDPLFAKYKERAWKSAYILIRVVKNRENGSVQEFGVVLSAPEPKEELKPTEVQAK